MSSVNHGPEHISGPLYVTSEVSRPRPIVDNSGKPITGAAYLQGPVQIGDDGDFPSRWATLMVGSLKNNQSETPVIPGGLCTGLNNPYSLGVIGDAAILDNLDVSVSIAAGKDIVAQGEVMSRCGGHILSAKKNFDIPHPTKEGWRLRHTCPEGPTNDVYTRGRVRGKKVIELPSYWKGLVEERSITVTLTPIGSHQDVIIKRWDEERVYLQSKGNMPIDCFYQIFAERKDGEALIAEYPGETPADYPGNACDRYLQTKVKFDDVQVTNKVTATTFQGSINVQSWKGFDIKHPNKENHRLRHICLEGPEAGVYIRGRLTGSSTIDLPEYWKGLIDLESITVSLTQIGSSQDLIVEGLEDWGTKVKVRSGNASAIDCYYTIQASRIDGEELIVEYEGETPADYPGSKDQFSISGFDY